MDDEQDGRAGLGEPEPGRGRTVDEALLSDLKMRPMGTAATS